MNKTTFIFVIIGLSLVGIAGRLLPHLPNATPIAALAFVSSMYFGRKTALLLPLTALLISDLFIGFYSISIMVSVYGSFALIAFMSWYVKKHSSILAVGYTIIAASLSFFLITNAVVWWLTPWYQKSFAGLLYSYELGLPFLRNMLLGDLVYTFTLLSAFQICTHRVLIGKKIRLFYIHLLPNRGQT